jgi:hypothetical protein
MNPAYKVLIGAAVIVAALVAAESAFKAHRNTEVRQSLKDLGDNIERTRCLDALINKDPATAKLYCRGKPSDYGL